MRRNAFFNNKHRNPVDSAEFVTHVHDAVDAVIDTALDYAVRFSDRLPWSADEITRHVDAFVSKHVPDAERCAESAWDDNA